MWWDKKPNPETYFDVLGLPVREYTSEEISEATIAALARAKKLPLQEKTVAVSKILSTFEVARDGIGSEYIDSLKVNERKPQPLLRFAEAIMEKGAIVVDLSMARLKEIGSKYKFSPVEVHTITPADTTHFSAPVVGKK